MASDAAEEWRDIPGYSGYQASSAGHLRTWRPRNRLARAPEEPRLLKPVRHSNEYLYVTLYSSNGSKPRQFRIHVVVMAVFVGPPAPGQQIRHLDGDKTNNRLSNLAYGSAKANADDRAAHGRSARGEAQGLSKLSNEVVSRVLEDARPCAVIARELGVNRTTVSSIKRRKTWRHIGEAG